MAEPEAAKTAHDQQTDAAAGPSGDAALKAIAHLQEVAESLAADAAKLVADEPAKDESAKTAAGATDRLMLSQEVVSPPSARIRARAR